MAMVVVGNYLVNNQRTAFQHQNEQRLRATFFHKVNEYFGS